MAKMFYTLEEAAAKLGVDPQEVKDLAAAGELQQFRDGSKLMFKREEIDARSSSGASGGDSGVIPLVGSGDTDAIDLSAESAAPSRRDDPRDETGVSVFDTGEIEPADPLAQTQVTSEGSGADESAIDLSTESVGSGSGLLDLTNESDDTSLGADLLDDIYPGGESGGSKVGSAAGTGLGTAAGTGVGASGVFDSAVGVEPAGGTQADQSFSGGDTLTAGEPVAAMPAAKVLAAGWGGIRFVGYGMMELP